MALIDVEVGGKRYPINCRDDEAEHVRRAAGLLDERCREVSAALGSISEPRLLLMGALLITDELLERRDAASARALSSTAGASIAGASIAGAATTARVRDSAVVEALADRVESLCAVLEMRARSA